ncbi:CNB_1a_G0026520.mRNA.1.CDS.1 [Saccharomyces cerevisiae]|nr:CNB_1a_G0026520.mRNA.1.CDS.1 [Saccharomyces cerevisiae]CAI7241077.1 CNB_1a_G0026520.mRNA.1.CDS.1 [Saccharomyces cerevisiae]
MSDHNVNSTFRKTLVELCETATWITSQVYAAKNLEKNDLITVDNKISALYPIAEKYDRSFRTTTVILDEELILKLENAASSLWNSLTIAMKAEKASDKYFNEVFCKCKIFATKLLSIHEALFRTNTNLLRNFKCYISSFKSASEYRFDDLITNTQQHSEKYLQIINEHVESFSNEEKTEFKKLTFEFYLVNFQLYLSENDLDTANIYTAKVNITDNSKYMDADLLIELCRMIYNSTVMLKEINNPETQLVDVNIISFLKDVEKYLELPVENLKSHTDYSNLKYSVLIFMANCLVEGYPQASELEQCDHYLSLLQNEYPNKVDPFILAINLTKRRNIVNPAETIEEILMRMIMSVDVISNFQAVIASINDLSKMDTKFSIVCLDYLLTNKLNSKNDSKFLEKAICSRFLITTQSKTMNDSEIAESLENFSTQMERIVSEPLTKHAISCIITLLWNTGKKLEKMEKYVVSIRFYKLALKDIISQNYSDRGKIQRALQVVYNKIEDYSNTVRVYQDMDEVDRQSPLCQLLMLQSFLADDKTEEALTCLQKIKSSEDEKSTDALILAVAECKRKTDLSVQGLLMIFDKLQSKSNSQTISSTSSSQTLSILRYTLQMIVKVSEEEPLETFINYLPTVQKLLQKAVEFLKTVKLLNQLPPDVEKEAIYQQSVAVNEIEWFASFSYNVAVKCLVDQSCESISEFPQYCIQFIDLIPVQDFTFPKMYHFTYWKFKATILQLIIAKEKAKQDQHQKDWDIYEKSEELVNSINVMKKSSEFKDGSSLEDRNTLHECFLEALTIHLESALIMPDQTRILDILKKTELYQDSRVDALLIDISSNMEDLPKGVLIEILETVLKRNMCPEVKERELCSWLRILLENAINLNHEVELRILDRVLKILNINQSSLQDTDGVLQTELETIATYCWNIGVNYIIKDNKSNGIVWCKHSMGFANMVNEGLQEQLYSLWESLASSANIDINSIAK